MTPTKVADFESATRCIGANGTGATQPQSSLSWRGGSREFRAAKRTRPTYPSQISFDRWWERSKARVGTKDYATSLGDFLRAVETATSAYGETMQATPRASPQRWNTGLGAE
jgi:hypothetical protein